MSPQVATVRHLHVLSQQLSSLRRNINPLHKYFALRCFSRLELILRCSLIIGLKNLDEERSTFALSTGVASHLRHAVNPLNGSHVSRTEAPSAPKSTSNTHLHGTHSHDGQSELRSTHSGFVSPMAKVYLSDVLDHVESALSSLDLFMGLCQQLEDYIFNLLSFNSNETMKSLTYVTIVNCSAIRQDYSLIRYFFRTQIFLPLSFLTGYYGMNFASRSLVLSPFGPLCVDVCFRQASRVF